MWLRNVWLGRLFSLARIILLLTAAFPDTIRFYSEVQDPRFVVGDRVCIVRFIVVGGDSRYFYLIECFAQYNSLLLSFTDIGRYILRNTLFDFAATAKLNCNWTCP